MKKIVVSKPSALTRAKETARLEKQAARNAEKELRRMMKMMK